MNAEWSRLFQLDTQPASLRDCYELVEAFIAALEQPTRLSEAALDAEQGARAGYLISAAQMIGGMHVHPSWAALQQRLRARGQQATGLVLLGADDGSNAYDDLARMWGLRKGLDTSKLTQIVAHGSS